MKVDPIKYNAISCSVPAILRECQSLIESSDLSKDDIGMTIYHMIGHVSELMSDEFFLSEESSAEKQVSLA